MTGPEANRIESFALTALFAAVSLGLLAALPLATSTGPATAGWWTRPALAPGVALGLLVLANLLSLVRAGADLRRRPPGPGEAAEALRAMRGWFLPLGYLGAFLGYVWLLGQLGFLLATAVFATGLIRASGLGGRWLWAGPALALALTAIFRWGLGVWMPRPWIATVLPADLGRFVMQWL